MYILPEEKNKKIKPSPKVWKYYKINGSTIVKLKKECPRCGKGFFLAEHKNRYTCGKCGDTHFIKNQ